MRLTKEQLGDRGRYQFRQTVVVLPELGKGEDGSDADVLVKTLSVKERDALPDLVDTNGNPQAGLHNLAVTFAAIVADPELTTEEAEEFLGDLPASALDSVIEKFGELMGGGKEEQAATVHEFHGAED